MLLNVEPFTSFLLLTLSKKGVVLYSVSAQSIQRSREIQLPEPLIQPVIAGGLGFEQRSWTLLRVYPIGERLLVALGRPLRDDGTGRSLTRFGEEPLVSGLLYCVDRESGDMLWPAPAEIDGHAFIELPLDPSPVACFASLAAPANEDEEARVRLLLLDLTTGRTLHREDDLPAPRGQRSVEATARLEETPSPMLRIGVAGAVVRLTATDSPSPPYPPALARVEQPSPRGATDKLGESLERLFQSLLAPAGQEGEERQP